LVDDLLYVISDEDSELLGCFINPSLSLFSGAADEEEAVTSCDVTSEMTLTEDDVDVTSLPMLADDELRVKSEPVEMYDDSLAGRQSGKTIHTQPSSCPPQQQMLP